MKKNIVIIVLTLLCVTLGIVAFSNKKETVLEEKDVPKTTHKELLSMMLEQTAGAGDYSLETRSSWPTKEDGYVFNSTLSKCEKGSKLKWDEENSLILMEGTTSDKCYVYFDVYSPPSLIGDVCNSGENLAGCVKILYQESNSDITNIYYHDSTLENGANDNSYRYAGSSDTTNNFVCFGSDAATCPYDNLYRIIGVFGDQVKLIKWDYASENLLGTDGNYIGIYTDDTSDYKGNIGTDLIKWYSRSNKTIEKTELLLTNLNTNFVYNIGKDWESLIADCNWVVQDIYPVYDNDKKIDVSNLTPLIAFQNENSKVYQNFKIGLMYIHDYGYAVSNINNNWKKTINSINKSENWMYMGLDEWTITTFTGISGSDPIPILVKSGGNILDSGGNAAVRPVFYLNSDVTYVSGSGAKEDSIRIN